MLATTATLPTGARCCMCQKDSPLFITYKKNNMQKLFVLFLAAFVIGGAAAILNDLGGLGWPSALYALVAAPVAAALTKGVSLLFALDVPLERKEVDTNGRPKLYTASNVAALVSAAMACFSLLA